MKTFKSLLYALVALFILASCSDDDKYVSGEPDDANCYGVYFPSQANAAALELDPAEPTQLTFKISRTKSLEAITVPMVVTGSEEGIFAASAVSFSVGEEEKEFTVSFPQAAIGTTYKCNIAVVDPLYVSRYSSKATGLDFSITRVKWDKVVGAGGEQFGKWRDDILSSAYGIGGVYAENEAIEIYERADKKGYYRIQNVYSAAYVCALFGDVPGNAPEYEGNRVNVTTYINATNPAKVWLPYQSTGATLNSGDGVISFGSFVDENFKNSENLYGMMVNGVITFPVKGLVIGLAGKLYPMGNGSGMQRIMLPGAKTYDYKLALRSAEPADGKVKITATFGTDVTKVKYAFFEGASSANVAAANSKAMEKNTVATQEITATGTIDAAMSKTGIYTIVGNIYNAKNELVDFAYLTFGFIANGETKPVMLTSGLIISDKYAQQGFTAEDSAEAYVFGEGIEWGYYGLFESDKLVADTDLAALVKTSGKAFKAEEIAAINDKGFSSVIGDLIGGTEYTLVVLAHNGYVSQIFTAKATTEGTPHPLKRKYTAADLLEPAITKEALFKKWNFWAVDKSAKPANSKRQKLGSLTFSENTADDVANADPNQATDAINVKGLSCGISAKDEAVCEFRDGLVALRDWVPLGEFTFEGSPTYLRYQFIDVDGYSYTQQLDYALIGGLVAEGYMAFVANPFYIEQGATFNGLLLVAFTDKELTQKLKNLKYITDLMCEDPAVAAPASQAVITHKQLQSVATKMFAAPQNFVELRGPARLKALIAELRTAPKTRVPEMSTNILRVEAPALGVAQAQVTFSPGVVRSNVGKAMLRKTIAAQEIELN